MSSSFKGINLFGSGPHRFSIGRQGQLLTVDFFSGLPGGGSSPQGALDLEVVVTGRLVANSESALWALRDAIVAQMDDPPTPGTLVDTHGRSWSDMKFVGLEEGDRTDRGRVWSMSYKASFRRI